jgi:hypothetical protein
MILCKTWQSMQHFFYETLANQQFSSKELPLADSFAVKTFMRKELRNLRNTVNMRSIWKAISGELLTIKQ